MLLFRARRGSQLHLPPGLYRCRQGHLLATCPMVNRDTLWGGLVLPGQVFIQRNPAVWVLYPLGPAELSRLETATPLITQALSQRLAHMEVLLALTNLRGLEERLFGFLLYCARYGGESQPDGSCRLPFPLTQSHLALVLKSNRSQVAQALQAAETQGLLLRQKQHRFQFPDLARLQLHCPIQLRDHP